MYKPGLPVVTTEVWGRHKNGSVADLTGMLMRKLLLQMGDQEELASPRTHA